LLRKFKTSYGGRSMYGNVSKAGLVGASLLPATGAAVNPWLSVLGYGLLAVTLGSFVYLKHVSKSVSEK
jgi:LPXTG-motif cell wall-anchored protein